MEDLVTGGSGFIGNHTLLQPLNAGQHERPTGRDSEREPEGRDSIDEGGVGPGDRVAVFGPVLGPDYSTSVLLIQRLMSGGLPGSPRLSFGVVDVRDVADLHIRAMTHPAAKGERFLATAGDFMLIRDIAMVLKQRMGAAGDKVPTRQLPNWLLRVAALRDPAVRQILPELGKLKNGSNEKSKRVLGWTPRSSEEAIVSTAESLLQ